MRDTNTLNYIRQLVTEQDERRAELAKMSRADREGFFAEISSRLFPATDPPQPLTLDDLQFMALVSTCGGGKILTLETVCYHLFNNAALYVENGNFTRENIENLHLAFTSRFN